MRVQIFTDSKPLHISTRRETTDDQEVARVLDPHRISVPLVAHDQQQYLLELHSMEDSFDVIVTYPNGTRECVWSLVVDPLSVFATEEEE